MGDDDFERTLAAPGTNAPAQLLLNSVIGGHYKLLSFIGRGGMGVVYRARNQAINLDVALKALAPEHLSQANWQRFQVKLVDFGLVKLSGATGGANQSQTATGEVCLV
jgi:hypothetical protein